jgi:putative ABC transport system permease protein
MSTTIQTLAALGRRPLRTFLTALGTALGIATIVALLAIGNGAQQSAGKFVKLGPSDIGLFQSNAADPTTSVLPLSLIPKLESHPQIRSAEPLLLMLDEVKDHPGAITFGATANGFLSRRLVFLKGHIFRSPNQAVVGNTLAASGHIRIGSEIVVRKHRLKVVGIYHIGVAYQDSGSFIPLKTAQRITGDTAEATTITVELAPGTSQAQGRALIKHHFTGISIIGDAQEGIRNGISGELLSNMTLVLAVLALVIGGIGVMNTMLMSVIERRSEFALLSAVGWSGPQIAVRVVIEGVVTTLIGAAIGLLLGVIGAQLLVNALGAHEYVSPDVTPWDLGRALLVGVLLGVLGGLYPAWRAARVSPAAVLAQR